MVPYSTRSLSIFIGIMQLSTDLPQTSKRPPVSAAIICFNEQSNIGRCLDALSWCEEIVVVDSGSTDQTCEIVKMYPSARLLVRPFDNYIAQKNFALDACRYEWVLSVDADEVLMPVLIDEISHLRFDQDGYFIRRRSFIGAKEVKYGAWNPDYKLRLFRRSAGRWGGSNPHECVQLNGSTECLNAEMMHFSYCNRDEFVNRNEKYTRMLVEYYAQRGKKVYFGQASLHWIGNFVMSYILRLGFLDGGLGLFIAYHMAKLSYMKYALLAKCKSDHEILRQQNALELVNVLEKQAN